MYKYIFQVAKIKYRIVFKCSHLHIIPIGILIIIVTCAQYESKEIH